MGSWFYVMVFYTYLIRFYDCCTVLHSVLCKERVEDIGLLSSQNRKEYWIVKLSNEQL